MADEQIKLILQLTDSGTIEEAIAKLTRLRSATDDTKDTYDVLARTVHYVHTEYVTLDRDMDEAVRNAVAQTQAQKALNQVLETSGTQLNKFGGFMEQHKFRILEAGRAVQDFAQGGIAGILNNIERLVGGSGALAGILTAVGVAAYVAWPYIKKWGEELGAAGEKFEVPTKGAEALTEALKKNKKEMEDLKEKTNLTYIELLNYVELAKKTAEMEVELARAKEARSVLPGASKAERARAGAVKEAIAEGPGTSELMIERIMDTVEGQQLGMKRIEEIITGAQKGFPADVKALQRLSPQFGEAYAQVSPERKAMEEQAKENFKKEGEFLDKRNKERERGDELWKKAEKELSDDKHKEETQQGHEGFRRFVRRMGAARQERMRGDREDKAEGREEKREALGRLEESKTGLNRMYQDAAYWDKFNSGMATVADQIARFKQLQERQIEDAQRGIQQMGNAFGNAQGRNEQTVFGGGPA